MEEDVDGFMMEITKNPTPNDKEDESFPLSPAPSPAQPSTSFLTIDFNYCLNCYQELKPTPKKLNRKRRPPKSHSDAPNSQKICLNTLVKVDDTKTSSKRTLLDILNLFFNIRHEAKAKKLDLDQVPNDDDHDFDICLCFSCFKLVEQMYELFITFCKKSESPSFMSTFLQKYDGDQQEGDDTMLKSNDTGAENYASDDYGEGDEEFIIPEALPPIATRKHKTSISKVEPKKSCSRQSSKRSCTNKKKYKLDLDAEVNKSTPDPSVQSKANAKASATTVELKLPKRNIKNSSHLGKTQKEVPLKRKSGPTHDRKAALQRRIDRLKRMKAVGLNIPFAINAEPKKKVKSISCEYCCAKFSKRSNYMDHSKCHETDQYASPCCNGTFNSEKNLKTHITLYHREHAESRTLLERQFACPECDLRFIRKGHLKVHLSQKHQITHDISSFFCPVCSKKFPTPKSLDVHLSKVHTPKVVVRKNECDECGRKFVKKGDLMNHITTHTNIRQFMCEICGFKSKRPQDLTRHRKLVHLKEINYTCDKCDKGYLSPWQLKAHQLTHGERKTFPCLEPNCGKAFRCPNNLRQHMHVHKGIKHVCHICGESYSRTAYLQRHLKLTHTESHEEPEDQIQENPSSEHQIIYLTTTDDENLMEGQHLHVYEDDQSQITDTLEHDLLTSIATEVIVHEVEEDEAIELNELDLSMEDDHDGTEHVILDDDSDQYEGVIMEYVIT